MVVILSLNRMKIVREIFFVDASVHEHRYRKGTGI